MPLAASNHRIQDMHVGLTDRAKTSVGHPLDVERAETFPVCPAALANACRLIPSSACTDSRRYPVPLGWRCSKPRRAPQLGPADGPWRRMTGAAQLHEDVGAGPELRGCDFQACAGRLRQQRGSCDFIDD
ncbi:MAG: hypothetical protein M1815_003311 [Lichina confinis]|nr:MAG: hypothetical protein M1815_003311 [Lichina confinis]